MAVTHRIAPCLWFDDQAEDTNLSQGGDPNAQQCGWLKDQYGLSWQVVPRELFELLKDYESPTAQRAMQAMLRMKKLDIGEIERAAAG
jgi:predicted 3-demethylubiquinone-9 3-methyltransferase (glyoxalase superfamily)